MQAHFSMVTTGNLVRMARSSLSKAKVSCSDTCTKTGSVSQEKTGRRQLLQMYSGSNGAGQMIAAGITGGGGGTGPGNGGGFGPSGQMHGAAPGSAHAGPLQQGQCASAWHPWPVHHTWWGRPQPNPRPAYVPKLSANPWHVQPQAVQLSASAGGVRDTPGRRAPSSAF